MYNIGAFGGFRGGGRGGFSGRDPWGSPPGFHNFNRGNFLYRNRNSLGNYPGNREVTQQKNPGNSGREKNNNDAKEKPSYQAFVEGGPGRAPQADFSNQAFNNFGVLQQIDRLDPPGGQEFIVQVTRKRRRTKTRTPLTTTTTASTTAEPVDDMTEEPLVESSRLLAQADAVDRRDFPAREADTVQRKSGRAPCQFPIYVKPEALRALMRQNLIPPSNSQHCIVVEA